MRKLTKVLNSSKTGRKINFHLLYTGTCNYIRGEKDTFKKNNIKALHIILLRISILGNTAVLEIIKGNLKIVFPFLLANALHMLLSYFQICSQQ